MELKRVFLSGRVTGAPERGPNASVAELFLIWDSNDGASQLWVAFLDLGDNLAGKVADGDIVAIVGWMPADKRDGESIRGPVQVESVLGMNHDGAFYGRIGR
jgi:hypothetical protein